jgi:hypothetical protein
MDGKKLRGVKKMELRYAAILHVQEQKAKSNVQCSVEGKTMKEF